VRRPVFLLGFLLACAVFPAAAAAGAIDLRIAYRESPVAAPTILTLRCDPARGTIRRPGAACKRLRAIGPTAFAATPKNMVCQDIFGGPQTAVVTGTYYGARVWAKLSRSDGCAIARWNRVAFLLPAPDS
jgi:hypothetical protein